MERYYTLLPLQLTCLQLSETIHVLDFNVTQNIGMKINIFYFPKEPFRNDVKKDKEEWRYPNSDEVREVA